MKRTRILGVLLLTCAIWLGVLPGGLRAQTPSLDELLKSNSHTIEASNRNLSGDGLEFLLRESSDAQFFAIAEPHNSKQVPEFTTLLFKVLHDRHGFNHLALEDGSVICRMFSAQATAGKRDAVIGLARRYPNALQFTTDQELRMIADAGGISTARSDRIWGLDRAFGALEMLDRLVELAPNADARNRATEMLSVVKGYEGERFAMNAHYLATVAVPDNLLKLADAYHLKKNSEADFLLQQLLLSTGRTIISSSQIRDNLPATIQTLNAKRI